MATKKNRSTLKPRPTGAALMARKAAPRAMKKMPRVAPAPNAAQMAAPAYRLAALDQDFLLSDDTRGVRFLLEYQKAEQARASGEKVA